MTKKLNKGGFGSYDMSRGISFNSAQVSMEILVEQKDFTVFLLIDGIDDGLRGNVGHGHLRPIFEVFVGEEFGNTVGQTFGLGQLIDYVAIILWI